MGPPSRSTESPPTGGSPRSGPPRQPARDPASERLPRLEASLPALISVTEKINEPRYPSFKGIMAAKKKPVETLTIADLGIDAGEVGLGNAWSTVVDAAPKPPRTAGQRVEDEGDGGTKVAEYLVGQKLI